MSYPLELNSRLYSTEMGLTLEVIGFVIFLTAIFDAISDPLMGFSVIELAPAGVVANLGYL